TRQAKGGAHVSGGASRSAWREVFGSPLRRLVGNVALGWVGIASGREDRMSRTLLIACTAIACLLVAALIVPGEFAQASPTADQTDDYVLVDPNIDGKGNPGMVFQENMAGVRRAAVGRYCLKSLLKYDHGPVARVSVDGPMSRDGVAIAVS